MKGTTVLWLLGSAVLGLVGLRYARLAFAANGVQLTLQGIKVASITLKGISFELTFLAENPSGSQIKLDYLTASISVRGSKVASIGPNSFADIRKAHPEYFVIAPETNQEVRVGVNATGLSIVNIARDWIQNGIPSKADIEGMAKMAGVQIPISTSINLTQKA
jgi:hypothetical protein